MNLEKSVGSRKSAQRPGLYSYMKNMFITNEVTSHFFITLFKSITCISFSRPAGFSRVSKARFLQGRVFSCLMLLSLVSVPAFADKKCEAVLEEGIYDVNSFLGLKQIEKSTREIACKARKDNFTFYYGGAYLNIATMEQRCNSSYDKVLKNGYEAKNLETLYNAILGSWAGCLKTAEGLKHWVSTIKGAPTQFNYLLDYDARTGSGSVDVSVDMQPQSVWKTCTAHDGSPAKNPVTVKHHKVVIRCSRDPNIPVTISLSASPDEAQKMSRKLILPAFKKM